MKKKLKISFLSLFVLLLPLQALPPDFNKNLTEDEITRLEKGETVIKSIKSVKKFSLQTNNEAGKKALQVVTALKPAYMAEIIKIYPYAGNEDFIAKFKSSVMDIESYVGIPYYSERKKEWYDLYSSANIKLKNENARTSQVLADLEMSPFGIIDTQIDTITDSDYFYYESTNLNKLRYHDRFNCVGKKKMKSILTIFKSGNYWVLYGIGAVDAPDIFFIRERAEISFMNRIKTFCSYFFTKLK